MNKWHIRVQKLRRILGTITHNKHAARKALRRGEPLRFIVGADTHPYPGWLSTNKEDLDITKRWYWRLYAPPDRVANVLAEHVFEHLTPEQARIAFKNIYEFLKPGGILRIAVPDGYHPSAYVRQLTGAPGTEPGADDHKVFYTIDSISTLGKEEGFMVDPIEYFDHEGIFHTRTFDFNNGYIKRSTKTIRLQFVDTPEQRAQFSETTPEHLRKQFVDKDFSYVSLLVDFKKPV